MSHWYQFIQLPLFFQPLMTNAQVVLGLDDENRMLIWINYGTVYPMFRPRRVSIIFSNSHYNRLYMKRAILQRILDFGMGVCMHRNGAAKLMTGSCNACNVCPTFLAPMSRESSLVRAHSYPTEQHMPIQTPNA